MTTPPDVSSLHLDRTTLLVPVRRALRKDRIDVDRWSIAPLAGGFAAPSGGVVRVSGSARDGDADLPWTLVVKQVVPPPDDGSGATDDPDRFDDWRRESLAYASGLLDDLPGGLVAPRCYGVEERPDGQYWLWLEDVGTAGSVGWSLESYALAARHLGAFNGAYLTARGLPDDPWLNADYLSRYLGVSPHEPRAIAALHDPATWRFARAREAFPVPTVERLLRLWSRYPRLIAASQIVPQTFCHLDAHRRNLVPRIGPAGVKQTVAIDWAAVGLAGLGADAAQLAFATLVFDEVAEIDPSAFAELIFESYLEGLRDAQWRGTRETARLGFAAFGIVRWAINVAGLILENLATDNPAVPAETESWLGRPIGRILPQWQVLLAYLLDLADEVR